MFLRKRRSAARLDSTLRVLIAILAIDAFRTLFENVYFGAYFNSIFGLLPGTIKDLLGNPVLIFLPKFVNIIAGSLVLLLLIRKWLPAIDTEQQARRASERSYQGVIASIDGIVWQIDARSLRVSLVSDAAERILGYPVSRLIDEPGFWQSRLHPDDSARVIEAFRSADNAQHPLDLTYRLLAADGHTVWLQTVANVVAEAGRPPQLRGISIDITKRRLQELKVAEDKRFIETIADNLPGLVTYWTPDLHCSFANRALKEWFGVAPEDVVGRHMREHLGDELFAKDSLHVEAVLAGQAQQFERTLIKADGTPVEVLAHYVPDMVDGVTRGFFALVSDISNIKSKEAQLALLEKSIARLSDVVMITEAKPLQEPGPRIVYVNEAFEQQTGYLPSEAIGRSPRFLQGPETSRQELEKIRQALSEGRAVHAEMVNYKKSGEPFVAEFDMAPIFGANGEITHMVSIQRDIGARKRQEQDRLAVIRQLSESEAFLNLVLQAVDAVITVRDRNGRLIRANRKAELVSGYTENELKDPDILSRLVPANEMAAVTKIRQSRNPADFPMTNINHWISRTGESRLLRWTNVALTDEAGAMLLQVSIGFDITEQRQYESDLIAAKNQAEQANRAKSSFLATMSHELRTPLNAVIGFSDVMSQQTFGPLGNQRYVEYTEDICRSGKQLLSMINDILDLSRIEAGKNDLKIEVLRISDVWAAIASALTVSAAQKDIRIVPPESDINIRFLGDHRAVMQVLTNLVGNAIKFTAPKGEVRIDCRRHDAGHEVVIGVYDNGRGIPANRLQDIMKPFVQVSSSHTRDAGGVGLGLAICQSLVSSMHGRIEITSDVGVGTTVLVYLPIAG